MEGSNGREINLNGIMGDIMGYVSNEPEDVQLRGRQRLYFLCGAETKVSVLN